MADLKVVLLGSKSTGKTCLFNRCVNDEFLETSMTIGAYFGLKPFDVDGLTVNIALWDTAGEERFDSLTSWYCRNAVAAIVCFDVSRIETWDSCHKWVNKVKSEAGDGCIIVLAGCKSDIVDANPEKRAIQIQVVDLFAKHVNALLCVDTSAKTGKNTDIILESIARHAIENHLGGFNSPTLNLRDLAARNRPSVESSSGCC